MVLAISSLRIIEIWNGGSYAVIIIGYLDPTPIAI